MTLSKGEELIAQGIVRWHPGCSGGEAWIKWGLDAIREYRQTRAIPGAILNSAQALWADKSLKQTRLLASPSPAGERLLCCGIYYLNYQRHKPVRVEDVLASGELSQWLGSSSVWVSQVANLVEAVFELPDDVIDIVVSAAAERSFRFPKPLDLQQPDDLLDAVEAIVGLENLIHTRRWPQLSGDQLDLTEARQTVEALLRIGSWPGSRSGKQIASKAFRWNFPPDVMDGHELELAQVHIAHFPRPDSPRRAEVRDRMIEIIGQYLAAPPKGTNLTACTAASILVHIGDEVALAKIIDWLSDYPRDSADLFPESLFDAACYEINLRGRRRDLLLGYTFEFADGPPPPSLERKHAIEIFRPIGGKCRECGSLRVAIFDILQEPQQLASLPPVRRFFIPMCPKCCENKDGHFGYLRVDNLPLDSDAWPAAEAASDQYRLPARQFRPLPPGDSHNPDTWFGGSPRWEQYPEWPKCERCRRKMIFAGQVAAGHTYYAFFCLDCLTTNVRVQYD